MIVIFYLYILLDEAIVIITSERQNPSCVTVRSFIIRKPFIF
jgi:hypothetical protein